MQDILASVGKFFWMKITSAFVAFSAMEFFVINNESSKVVAGLVYIVILDSILGVITAIIYKRFASWRMGQLMARKVALYAFAMYSAFILSSSSDTIFFWVPTYLGLFFIASEMLSVMEKLALMGLNLPMGLVARVNDLFRRLNDGDQDALKEIYRKK